MAPINNINNSCIFIAKLTVGAIQTLNCDKHNPLSVYMQKHNNCTVVIASGQVVRSVATANYK